MMLRVRLNEYLARIRAEVYRSFTERHTPHQIAGSFAIGTFITMLPTLGTGLIMFVILSWLSDWFNKVALFSSVVVFNPIVKWGVYAASFTLGFLLLGPVEGVALTEFPSLDAGADIIIRLWVGNLILAIIAAVLGYGAVYHLVIRYRSRQMPVFEKTVEQLIERQVDTLVDDMTGDNSDGEPSNSPNDG